MRAGFTSVQRALALAGGILVLPAVVVLAATLVLAFQSQTQRAERRAADRAEAITAAASAVFASDQKALRTLASASSLRRGDYDDFEERTRELLADFPDWKAIFVLDDRGAVLADTSAVPRALSEWPHGSVLRTEQDCPCVVVSQTVPGASGQRLVLLTNPDAYQSLLLDRVRPGDIAAIVDREGRFVARSLDFEHRVGTMATVYVRRAARHGGAGKYRGVTLEGVENYSLYASDRATGWSAHVAMTRRSIDNPRFWTFVAFAGGALATLIISAGLAVYIIRDLQARRREEARQQASQRVEQIGRFASGTAHDLNNMLTVVVGNLQRIVKKSEDPHIHRAAKLAQEAADRGARLVQALLTFARGGSGGSGVVDLAALIRDVEPLLSNAIAEEARLEISSVDGPLWIWGNRDQLEQAIINLVINARDAVQGRPAPRIRVIMETDGRHAVLTVEDNGPGLVPETAALVFEPFFTTKPPGVGTGLGLAQVAQAVSASNGLAEFRTSLLGGAAFVVTIPMLATAEHSRP